MIEVYKNTLPAEVETELIEFELTYPALNFAFQNFDYFRANAGTKYHTPYCFINRDGQGLLNGVMMAVVIDSYRIGPFGKRCVIWGEPVFDEGPEVSNILSAILIRLVAELARKVMYIEFRNNESRLDYAQVFLEQGFLLKSHSNLIIRRHALVNAFEGLSETKRRQIRRAKEQGVVAREARSMAEVHALYNILDDLYTQKVKKPLPHLSFFEQFFSPVKHKLGVILVVMKGHELIGGAVLLTEANKGVYEWYVAGLDKRYKKMYPSVVATWSAIEFASENGYDFFDFMGGGQPGEYYGVRNFKMKFGPELVNHGRWFFSKYKGLIRVIKWFIPKKIN